MSEFYSVVRYYEGALGETDFTITFPYLRKNHIYVYLAQEPLEAINPETGEENPPISISTLQRGVHYDIINDQTVRLDTPLGDNESLTIRRFTEMDQRLASYFDASYLTETELNEVTLQLLYLIQEIQDIRNISDLGSTIPGDPGDGNQGDTIEDLIAQLEQTPLFQELMTLIPMLDFNAESIIRTALQEHENWKIDEARGILKERTDAIFDQFVVDTGANFVDVQESVEEEGLARATAITGVTAKIDNDIAAAVLSFNEAIATESEARATAIDLVRADYAADISAEVTTLNEAISNETSARALAITDVQAEFADAKAFVTELNEAYAGVDSAATKLVTQLDARLLAADLETSLASSEYVGGIETRVTNTETGLVAEGSKIDSLVSRVNQDLVDANGNIVPGGALSIVQTTADTAASSASTSATKLETLGSIYGLDANNWTAAQFASAIQDEYETYADANVAEASRFYSLQANAKPTIYSATVPNPNNEPYATDYAQFINNSGAGFPQGTIWVREYIPSGGSFTRRHYEWSTGSLPVGVPSGETNGPDVFAVSFNWDNLGLPSTSTGYWVDTGATALGALVARMEDASVSPGSATAMLKDQIQATVDGVDAAIQNNMYIDVTGGNVDARYSTRINVTRPDGQVVMSGFGLGTTSTPDSSRSDFIVMANYFSLVAPPSSVDWTYSASEEGDYSFVTSPDNTIVPFMVDTDNETVYINGDLFVSDTLYGYQGRLREVHLGKAVFGQMASAANNATTKNPAYNNLVDTNGYRMELLSSTDGFWNSTDRNYLQWAGTGTRNDNNAVYWIDENGNAFFGGTVQAGNIAGSLSNVFNRSHSNSPWSPSNGSTWKNCKSTNDGWEYFYISSSRYLTPVFLCNFSMVHGRAGEVQVIAEYDSTGGGTYTGTTTIAAASWTMDRTDGAQNVSVQGALPFNTNTSVRVKLQFRDPYGFPHSNDGYNILALMLPDSGTASGGGTSSTGNSTTQGTNPDVGTALM